MKSIRSKIFLLILLSVVISALIIGSLGIFVTSGVVNKNAKEYMNLLCLANAEKLDCAFSSIENSVQTLARYASEELESPQALSDTEYCSTFTAALQKSALHHIENSDGAMSVYVRFEPTLTSSAEGFFLVKNTKTGEYEHEPLIDLSKYDPDDVSHVGWWYIPKQKGCPTWLDVYHNANIGHTMFSYVVPLYKDDTFIGVIGTDISVDFIRYHAQSISIYETGKVSIFDKNGTVIYHPDIQTGDDIEAHDPDFAQIAKNLGNVDHTDELISYTFENVEKLLASRTLSNGMVMACFAPVSEIYIEQERLIREILITTGFVIVISLFLAILLSNRITKPIKKLNNAAKHLLDGERSLDIDHISSDEVGELTQTLLEVQRLLKNQFDSLDAEAHRDGLTGVGNKSAYIDAEAALNVQIENGDVNFAIAVFDVNKLKVTNDVFGHIAGDRLLASVSAHIAAYFDLTEVFRIGGDEFVVIVKGDRVSGFSEKIKTCVETMRDDTIEGFPEIRATCAYGVAVFDSNKDHTFSDVLRNADKQMYKNKTSTKQETFPWEEGVKGYKRIQTERYAQLLQTLSGNTDDYLFLINTETQTIHLFRDKTLQVYDIPEFLQLVHTNDAPLAKEQILRVIHHESDALDINLRMIIDDAGNTGWVNLRGNITDDDTTDKYMMIGRVSQNAVKHLYDRLTTLFNKVKLKADLLDNTTPPFKLLMLVDVDNLSEINFRHGSAYGNEVLSLLADTIESRFTSSRVYHAEKNRFVILLDTDSKETVEQLYQDLRQTMEEKCTLSAAVVPNDKSLHINEDNIYDYAEQVLISFKKTNMGQMVFSSKESYLERLASIALLEELEASIINGCDGFSLVFQPQICTKDYTILSAEALLRYTSPTKGMIYPDQFIPILEKTGLINDVGLWVVEMALLQCKKWREKMPDFRVCVNISSIQLKEKSIALQIISLLDQIGLPGSALTLEITESIPLEKSAELSDILAKFKSAGITIAIDDFGTGYSNIAYLTQMHADIIKVDRMFVSGIQENSYNYNLIYNISEFARNNDLQLCIEGVETIQELVVLSNLQANYIQGYLFDKPCSPDELEDKYFNSGHHLYSKRAELIAQLKAERDHAPSITIDTRTILNATKVGLWVIRLDLQSGEGELFTDSAMRELLGVDDTLTPKACYRHWYNHIKEGFEERVNSMVSEMQANPQITQVEYSWCHPQRGDVVVRCTGRCVQKNLDIAVFEGFHRILSDMNKTF